jgi:hypothetical protein
VSLRSSAKSASVWLLALAFDTSLVSLRLTVSR